jgi:lipopolysaccharide heptosyltransferase I
MTRILLVKTSSLGDVVHNLPVASDVRAARPGADIDWMVEERLAAIPRLHPAVNRVLPVAFRRWRRTLWQRQTRHEIREFLGELRQREYDAVIDTQGLLKSALLAKAARGARFGLDWASAREPLSVFYDHTFSVSWTLHAVARNRLLAAQALGYAPSAPIDYGIRAAPAKFVWLRAARYAVLLHATSARRKLWPETNWIETGRNFMKRDICSVLPWGNAAERARSESLAARIPGAIVAPALALNAAAGLLAGASAIVGVDTGLTHLAAALGAPTVGIYCATDPAATGLFGCARAVNLGGTERSPTAGEVMGALAQLLA